MARRGPNQAQGGSPPGGGAGGGRGKLGAVVSSIRSGESISRVAGLTEQDRAASIGTSDSTGQPDQESARTIGRGVGFILESSLPVGWQALLPVPAGSSQRRVDRR